MTTTSRRFASGSSPARRARAALAAASPGSSTSSRASRPPAVPDGRLPGAHGSVRARRPARDRGLRVRPPRQPRAHRACARGSCSCTRAAITSSCARPAAPTSTATASPTATSPTSTRFPTGLPPLRGVRLQLRLRRRRADAALPRRLPDRGDRRGARDRAPPAAAVELALHEPVQGHAGRGLGERRAGRSAADPSSGAHSVRAGGQRLHQGAARHAEPGRDLAGVRVRPTPSATSAASPSRPRPRRTSR